MADWMAANVHALLGMKVFETHDYGSKYIMSGFRKRALVQMWLGNEYVAELVPCF
jgi:hypothetical protein